MIDKETKSALEEITVAVKLIDSSTAVFQEVNQKLEYLPKAHDELLEFRKQLASLKTDTAAEVKKLINTHELEKISLDAVKTLDYLADETIPELQKASEQFKKSIKSQGLKSIFIGAVIGGALTYGYMSHFHYKMQMNLADFAQTYYEDASYRIIGIPTKSYYKKDENLAYFKIDKTNK